MGILLIVVIVLVGYLIWQKGSISIPREKEKPKTEAVTKAEKWYAVFLSNGQVYFGHLTDENKNYVKLTEVYYLQLEKPLQPATPGREKEETGEGREEEVTGEREESAVLSLVKLGQELHGPTDAMLINRDHVIFYEALKSNSKVVQSIEEYKK